MRAARTLPSRLGTARPVAPIAAPTLLAMLRPSLACLLVLSACVSDAVDDGASDEAPVDGPVDLVVDIGTSEELTASVDGLDQRTWHTATRSLPDRAALAGTAIELTLQRGDELHTVTVRSVCTNDDLRDWHDSTLTRETINIYLRWPADAARPTAETTGRCEYTDHVLELWGGT
jgi:hypothetical protein